MPRRVRLMALAAVLVAIVGVSGFPVTIASPRARWVVTVVMLVVAWRCRAQVRRARVERWHTRGARLFDDVVGTAWTGCIVATLFGLGGVLEGIGADAWPSGRAAVVHEVGPCHDFLARTQQNRVIVPDTELVIVERWSLFGIVGFERDVVTVLAEDLHRFAWRVTEHELILQCWDGGPVMDAPSRELVIATVPDDWRRPAAETQPSLDGTPLDPAQIAYRASRERLGAQALLVLLWCIPAFVHRRAQWRSPSRSACWTAAACGLVVVPGSFGLMALSFAAPNFGFVPFVLSIAVAGVQVAPTEALVNLLLAEQNHIDLRYGFNVYTACVYAVGAAVWGPSTPCAAGSLTAFGAPSDVP